MDNGLWTLKFSKDEKPITGKVYRFFGEKSDIKKVYFGSLLNGKMEGRWTTWWDNGHKWFKGNYKDGKRVGFVTEWFENGQKYYEGEYKDGKTDVFTKWYENGQKEIEGTFNDETLISSTKRWLEDGTKFNGVITTTFVNEMKLKVTYDNGKEISRIWWNKDGSVKE